MLYVGGRVSVRQVDGCESQGVQQAVGWASGVVLQYSDAALDVNRRALVEGTLGVQVVIQNDGASHTSQAEHVRAGCLVLLPLHHFVANVCHRSESVGDVVPGHTVTGRKELHRRLVDDVHHGRGVGEEERHPVRQLVADADVEVLLRELHAVEGAPVVGEVVLDRRVDHLEVVKAQDEVEDVSQLLGQRLEVCKAGLGVVLAECHQKLGEAVLQLEGKVIELLQLVHGRKHTVPRLLLRLCGRVCDSLANKLFASLIGR
mmetsp:Transcript_117179/g.164827  ORF Transcript_117179/g.164827 Transcript_117179/m.164827 type:complete len:260 (-) Transcript_117179:403-1182(-)